MALERVHYCGLRVSEFHRLRPIGRSITDFNRNLVVSFNNSKQDGFFL